MNGFSDKPFLPVNYSRQHLIEQIMAMVGRSLPEPRRVRNFLEHASTEALVRLHGEIMDVSLSDLAALIRSSINPTSSPSSQSSALAGDDNAAADVSKLSRAASLSAPAPFAPGLTTPDGKDKGTVPALAVSLSTI